MQFALPLSLLLPFCDLYYGGSTVLSIVNSFVHMFALRELVEINIHTHSQIENQRQNENHMGNGTPGPHQAQGRPEPKFSATYIDAKSI